MFYLSKKNQGGGIKKEIIMSTLTIPSRQFLARDDATQLNRAFKGFSSLNFYFEFY